MYTKEQVVSLLKRLESGSLEELSTVLQESVELLEAVKAVDLEFQDPELQVEDPCINCVLSTLEGISKSVETVEVRK